MLYLEFAIAAAVLFAVGAIVAVRRRELSDAGRDSADTRLPPSGVPMTPADVDGLRFGLAFRGYRMDQVDDALDRLREELDRRDERIVALDRPAGGRLRLPSAEPTATAVDPAEGADDAASVETAADAEPVEPATVEAAAIAASSAGAGAPQASPPDAEPTPEPTPEPAGPPEAETPSFEAEPAPVEEAASPAEPASAFAPEPIVDLPGAPPQEPLQPQPAEGRAAEPPVKDGISKLRRREAAPAEESPPADPNRDPEPSNG
ncbi:MAG: DivIVA domain-containing protein [Actinomycetes bacterium]